MQEKQKIDDLNKLRDLCIKNAEELLSASKLALDNKIDHVSFHLSKLALEEIGKLHIATLEGAVKQIPREKETAVNFSTDDHQRKLFFAIWSPSFGRTKQTKEQFQENQHLAKTIQERSLSYLYIDPLNMLDWKEKMEEGEAKRLYEFVSVRLKYEKEALGNLRVIPAEEKAELEWFFKINEDLEKRKEIWGHKSQEKLIELESNVQGWIRWLKGIYDKNEQEMREYAEKEIKRQKPSAEEAFEPKYKMRVRIQSQSHSIANDAFKKWNEGVKDIKIYKSDKKDTRKTARSELLIDFLFPKALPIGGLWEHGFFMSKTLVIALNIATKGLFWWNVEKDIEKYFEEITDLEADKSEKVKISMSMGKRLAIDWGTANMSLDQEEMSRVMMIFAFLMNENQKMEKFLKGYAMAMILFSKTDIHLRLEVNAFDEFFKAFKEALLAFGDWNGKDNIKEIIKNKFSKLGELKDLDEILDLVISLDNDPEHKKVHSITLTEVAAIKLYCDFYVQMKVNEHFEKTRSEK